jgi:hypothetical protein
MLYLFIQNYAAPVAPSINVGCPDDGLKPDGYVSIICPLHAGYIKSLYLPKLISLVAFDYRLIVSEFSLRFWILNVSTVGYKSFIET